MRRRRKDAVLCVAGIAALCVLFIAVLRLPDEPNIAREPSFSREDGFYDEPFYLELSGGDGKIYYTLDSSEPDENSILYTGPILIQDASSNENVYSMIADTCIDQKRQILDELGVELRYHNKLPSHRVDKATVVRAVCVDAFGNRSNVATKVYFVGFEQKKGYDGMNIMAITTSPANLFDYDTGMYVMGRLFDEAIEDESIERTSNYSFWEANYWQKGKKWERKAYICFFDRDKNLTLSGDFGIRIQGRGSRAMLPKSFNIYARGKYGAEWISGDALFGENIAYNRLNLNSGANGMDTMLTDYLVNSLCGDLRYDTRPYEPCEMFLDGEYWGVYWLTPRYKQDYFVGKYGIDASEIIEIKAGKAEIGDETDAETYETVFRFIASGDMSDPDMYAKACELIDIDSYIDYYATEIYIANTDWPVNNNAAWRTRSVSDWPYADGKWRWMMYDVNISMENAFAKSDFVQRTAGRDTMFCSLLDNSNFEAALYDKLVELAEGCFDPARVDAFIDEYEAMMVDAMEKEYARFYDGDRTRQDFLGDCENIRTFFHDRHDYIMEVYGER